MTRWPDALAEQQLASRRRGDRGVSVIVPRSPDGGGPRDRAWAWLARRYAALFPEWEVLEGMPPPGPWCKGAAVDQAVERARGAVLVIADADCVVAPEALREAVRRVEEGAPWVMPHRLFHRLNPSETAIWLGMPASEWRAPSAEVLAQRVYEGFPGGGLLVVSRPSFTAAGGIPRVFVGWGEEDRALALILDGLLGRHERLDYDLVHLWHPQESRRSLAARRNLFRFWRFARVANNPEALWRLVQRVRA